MTLNEIMQQIHIAKNEFFKSTNGLYPTHVTVNHNVYMKAAFGDGASPYTDQGKLRPFMGLTVIRSHDIEEDSILISRKTF